MRSKPPCRDNPRDNGSAYRRLRALFDAAVAQPDDARDAWVAAEVTDDSERAALLRLLKADAATGYLETPAAERASRIGADPVPEASVQSLVGRRIGAFRLVRVLGRGGMAAVFLGEREDADFRQQAAVKLLRRGLYSELEQRLFQRERRALAALEHPNIARLIDGGVTEAGIPYLVMEYVAGVPITEYLREHEPGLSARLRLFAVVCHAVSAAHQRLIVHRDIKPSNILVTGEGEVKLLDFGIAKLLDEDGEGITATGLPAFTPGYAAPEQYTGGPISTATDVYALGVLLYELLLGERPGEPLRRPSARAAELAATGAVLLQAAGVLKGDIDNILRQALDAEPERRYPTAAALADDIECHLRAQPVAAHPPSAWYGARKFMQRHRLAIASASAVALLLAGLVSFYTVRLTAERDRARLEAQRVTAVSTFLTELFRGADPYATRESIEPSVRELLAAGAERVQRELADQPGLRADMLTVIGQIHERLGDHAQALPLLQQALLLRRGDSNADAERLGQTLNHLGVLLREQGDIAAATPMLEEALALRRRALGSEHADVAITLVELGRAYEDQGLLNRAEPLFREALTIRRRVFGDIHRETATSASALGLLLRQKGELEAALELLRENVAICRQVLREDHPNLGASVSSLGLIMADLGELARAESLLRESLAIHSKIHGPNHASVARALNNLSQLLLERGSYAEAEEMLEEALQTARSALGDDHPLTATVAVNMARVRLAQGDAATAETLLQDALRVRRRVLSEGDWRIGVAKSLLGASLTALGRYAEAEPFLLAAAAALHDVPGQQSREAEANRGRLRELYAHWNRGE